MIVSGDGLIYEVVNGLMQHEKWEQAIKLPLGCLPGGSGNALAAALLYAAKYVHIVMLARICDKVHVVFIVSW